MFSIIILASSTIVDDHVIYAIHRPLKLLKSYLFPRLPPLYITLRFLPIITLY
jgi:hypothetical protein